MMKKYILIAAISAGTLWMVNSCKEIGPDINLGGNKNVLSDTTYVDPVIPAAQPKNVVLEEFTGVRCTNCPQGHQIIYDLKAQYPGRVISLSCHPFTSLTAPYSYSVQDLRTQKAQDLFAFLGNAGNLPIGSIDRKLFSGQSALLVDKQNWSNFTTQQISLSPPVNIDLQRLYDSVSRELTVIATVVYTQPVTQDNRLTIALTESKIVTAQLDGTVHDTFYTHNDVLRDFITGTQGDVLDADLVAGRTFKRIYKRTLEPKWKAENMHIAAYVHEHINAKQIYQGREIDVK